MLKKIVRVMLAVTVLASSLTCFVSLPTAIGADETVYLDVPNSSFEEGAAGRNGTMVGWNALDTTSQPLGDDMFYEIQENTGTNNSRGLRVYHKRSQNGSRIQLLSDPFDAAPENALYDIEYTMSFEHKQDQTGYWLFKFYNAEDKIWNPTAATWDSYTAGGYWEYIGRGAENSTWGRINGTTTVWKPYEVTKTAPAGTVKVKVGFYNSVNFKADLYVDDVKVSYVKDTTPPAAVTGLTAKPKNGAVSVKWTDPADEDLEKILVEIWQGGSIVGTPIEVAKGVGEYNAEGLTNDIEYTFKVSAVDGRGNVSSVEQASATPSATIQNHPPVCIGIENQTIWADETLRLPLDGYFTDADGDTIQFSTDKGTIASGNVLTYTPTAAETVTVTISAFDGTDTTPASFDIIVEAVPNETPESNPPMAYLSIANPGFERGALAKNVSVPGWSLMDPKDVLTDDNYFAVTADGGKDGSRGLVLNDTISGAKVSVASDPIVAPAHNLTEEVEYTLSFDYISGRRASYFVNFYNEAGLLWNGTKWNTAGDYQSIGGIYDQDAGITTNSWTNFTGKVTAPVGTTTIRVGFVTTVYHTYKQQMDNVKMSYSSNKAPVIQNPLAAQNIKVGETVNLDIGNVFSDPNGDEMTYQTDKGIIAGTALIYQPTQLGDNIVTLTATDIYGDTGTATVTIAVAKNENQLIADKKIKKSGTGLVQNGSFIAYKDGAPIAGLSKAQAGDTISLKTTVNNISGDLLDATVVVLKHNALGAVVGMKSMVLTIPVTDSYELSIDYQLSDNEGSVTVMIWDSLSHTNAFCRPTVIGQ